MFAGITFAELGWSGALLAAACGLIITFMMLGILAVVILAISKIVAVIEGRKASAAQKTSDRTC